MDVMKTAAWCPRPRWPSPRLPAPTRAQCARRALRVGGCARSAPSAWSAPGPAFGSSFPALPCARSRPTRYAACSDGRCARPPPGWRGTHRQSAAMRVQSQQRLVAGWMDPHQKGQSDSRRSHCDTAPLWHHYAGGIAPAGHVLYTKRFRMLWAGGERRYAGLWV